MSSIKKVAVIGSGVMGSGIAAQVANAGLPVILLDIVGGDSDRNAVAKAAVQRMLKTSPAPLMHPRNTKRIQPGNIDDHLEWVSDCDLIIEVVLENLDIKQALYEKLEAHRKPGSIVTSNTSTIPLQHLIQGRSEDFRKHFAVTHFFNPPRYMRLLELVEGPETRADAAREVHDFCDRALGKGVVECKDTPGFIGNRIGVYWLQCAVLEAIEKKVAGEEVVIAPAAEPRDKIIDLMAALKESLAEKRGAARKPARAKGGARKKSASG